MAQNDKSYHEQKNIENTQKMREIVSGLPAFCRQFFRGIEEHSLPRTRLAYAYDLRVFFEFIKENNPSYKNKEIKDFPFELLENITARNLRMTSAARPVSSPPCVPCISIFTLTR